MLEYTGINADVAELADALDSKSSGKPCGFESHHQHQKILIFFPICCCQFEMKILFFISIFCIERFLFYMSNKENQTNQLLNNIFTIAKSFIILLILGFLMLYISSLGPEIYTKNSFEHNFTGGWLYNEYLNPIYGILGLIIYIS